MTSSFSCVNELRTQRTSGPAAENGHNHTSKYDIPQLRPPAGALLTMKLHIFFEGVSWSLMISNTSLLI